MIQGVLLSFASVFLLNAGFGNRTIGIVTCLGNLLSLFLQSGLAHFTDKNRQISLAVIIRSVKYAVLFCVVPLLFLYHSTSIWTLVCYTLALTGHLALLPLVNELNYRMEAIGIRMNFGLCRSMGSLGYSALCIVLGYLTNRYGSIMVPICAATILLFFIISLTLLQKLTGTNYTPQFTPQEESSGGIISYIQHNKNVFIVSIGAAMLLYSSQTFGIYMLQILSPLGGGAAEVGISNALQAIFEIPALALFSLFAKKWSDVCILKCSAFGFVLKAVLFLTAKSVNAIFLAQITQFFGYALFFPAMVGYLHDVSSVDEAATGQTLFSMMTAVSGVAATLSGGMIIDALGIPAQLIICLILTLLGSLLVCIFAREQQKQLNQGAL